MKNKAGQPTAKEAWALNKKALAYWWKADPQIFISTAASEIVKAAAPYVTIYFSAQLIGEIAGPCRPQQLIRIAMVVLIATAAMNFLGASLQRWKNAVHSTTYYINKKQQLDKMFSMDFCDTDNLEVQNLLQHIQEGDQWSGWGTTRVCSKIFGDAVTAITKIIGALVLSVTLFTSMVPQGNMDFLNSPLAAVLILALMLATSILSPILEVKGNSYFVERGAQACIISNRGFSSYAHMAIDDRSRAEDVRIYCQEGFCTTKTEETSFVGKNGQLSRWAKGPMGFFLAAAVAVSRIFTGVAYLFVCLKAWAGAFGVGYVTQYISAITSLSSGVSLLLSTWGMIRTNAIYLKDTFAFLELPNKMYQGSLTVEKRSDRNYQVEFRNVSFQYPGSQQWALRNVSMKFTIGERLAVVGQNGSGKTTMIKLLCRLYDPAEGEILLNGINIRKYNYKEYMSIFSVVFQDFQLLSLPLGQNVAAAGQYDNGWARQCLEEAGFGPRLATMPQGLETCLFKDFDNKGVAVSGGEAQKIAIARALYKNAPFIVLDEPTAALDPIAEAEIYAKFNTLIQDRTAVYISHRLSSCRFCDRIAVFHEGSVVQFGTHEELLADKNGQYNQLWNAQAQYYVS